MEMEGSNSIPTEITLPNSVVSIGGKPLTRLQRHAPAALCLDEITTARKCLQPYLPSACVIPLLSPLSIPSPSPHWPCEEDAEQSSPTLFVTTTTSGNNNFQVQQQGITVEQQVCDLSVAAIDGWQHPAATALAEPSTLFAILQTQCSLVHPTPTN